MKLEYLWGAMKYADTNGDSQVKRERTNEKKRELVKKVKRRSETRKIRECKRNCK